MANEYVEKSRQELVNKLITQLKNGTAPWQKPWTSQNGLIPKKAYNPVTNQFYGGLNQFRLYLTAFEKGYSDPRWCTFETAKRQGWSVKKGEKATQIEKAERYDKTTKKTFDVDTVKDMSKEERAEYIKKNTYVYRKIYYVFNATQIDNIPALEKETETEKTVLQRHERLENLISNFQCPVFFDKDDSAFYNIAKDEIHLPLRESFKNEYGLYSTFLHEAAHSTGHSSRLNRFKGAEANATFGSENYAKEELRAEIASMFLGTEYHLENSEQHIEQHAAYVESWIKGLTSDKNYLFDAIAEAEKISKYLTDYEHSLNQETINENILEQDTEQMSETSQDGQNEQNKLESGNQPATSQDVQTSENASRTVQQQQSKEYPVFVQRTEDVIRESAKLALKTGEPMVAFEWCELNKPEYRGTVMPLSMADRMLTEDNQRYLSEGGYFKTKLHISYLDSNGKIQQYLDCRYDIGSENGGLEKHIREAYDGLLKAGFSSKEERDEIFKMCDYLFSKDRVAETERDAQSEQNKPESENEAQESPKKPPKSISDTAEEEKPQNFEEKPQKTKVINLYAGPGAGKTTAALQICLELKKLGINAEYVSEFAKDLIYDGKEEMLKDQRYVTDGQYERLNRLRGKVDVIVTDSPLLLGQVYGKKSVDKEYKDEIRKRYDSFDNYNAFIVRGNNFTQKGRVHNLEESKQLDADVLQMLSDNKIFHGYYKQDNLSEAVENIEKWLDKDKVSTIANEADVADKALTNSTSQPKTKKIKQRVQDR